MSNETDTKLVEVLSAHYTDTFNQLKTVVAKRERLFLYILLLIFVLLLYMSSPTVMSEWLNSFFSTQVAGSNGAVMKSLVDVSVIGVVLLLGLLSISHTYFQAVLHVERQYAYVYQLEDQLSRYFNGEAFTREGRHYMNYKRKFSKWTKVIFWYLFPFLYLSFIVIWFWFLLTNSQTPIFYMIVDAGITVSILVSLGYYLLAILKKK